MRIMYDNSLYCTIPPETSEYEVYPLDIEKWKIQDHLDEENYDNGFDDIEDIRNQVLIEKNNETVKTDESKRAIKCL